MLAETLCLDLMSQLAMSLYFLFIPLRISTILPGCLIFEWLILPRKGVNNLVMISSNLRRTIAITDLMGRIEMFALVINHKV